MCTQINTSMRTFPLSNPFISGESLQQSFRYQRSNSHTEIVWIGSNSKFWKSGIFKWRETTVFGYQTKEKKILRLLAGNFLFKNEGFFRFFIISKFQFSTMSHYIFSETGSWRQNLLHIWYFLEKGSIKLYSKFNCIWSFETFTAKGSNVEKK